MVICEGNKVELCLMADAIKQTRQFYLNTNLLEYLLPEALANITMPNQREAEI